MSKRKKLKDDPIVRLVGEHGLSTSLRASGCATAWIYASMKLGRDLSSWDEYRDWWKLPERSYYREKAAYRQVFKTDSPAELVEVLRKAGVLDDFAVEKPSPAVALGLLHFAG